MGFSQDDADWLINMSRIVVHLLWNQYQNEASVSRRHVPSRPRATTPAGDRSIALSARRRRRISVPQLVADHSVASWRRISAAKASSQFRSLCKVSSCVCTPQPTTEKSPLILGKRTPFLDQAAMGFCTLCRRVQIHTGERFRTSSHL
ncbi:uncharacterized protein TNCV_652151 [Trichonephila clavipes]|nr:uncharacterized protein TNCV_652151 [Trichonephila clavipes]